MLFIDEVQYLTSPDFAALIVALHNASQENLPILFFGAGLPQVAAFAGETKSYSERLFEYPPIDKLDPVAARAAIAQPIRNENETINEAALDEIVHITEGYPYFLQEWGYQLWNVADQSPIKLEHVQQATPIASSTWMRVFFALDLIA